MQNHATNFGLSKQLKELGVPQKSEFYWGKTEYSGEYFFDVYYSKNEGNFTIKNIASAFLASELMEMLPVGTQISSVGDGYKVSYADLHCDSFDRTTQDALGLMLIYLIEHKLIEI